MPTKTSANILMLVIVGMTEIFGMTAPVFWQLSQCRSDLTIGGLRSSVPVQLSSF